jgi:hypothetical protein
MLEDRTSSEIAPHGQSRPNRPQAEVSGASTSQTATRVSTTPAPGTATSTPLTSATKKAGNDVSAERIRDPATIR